MKIEKVIAVLVGLLSTILFIDALRRLTMKGRNATRFPRYRDAVGA